MADCLKTWNLLTNTIIFPGSLVPSSYSVDDYNNNGTTAASSVHQQRLLFIPFADDPECPCPHSGPKYVVCLLTSPRQLAGSCFFIHWHGNMTDLGQLAVCARYESEILNAHHLAVEFPRYGVCRDGFPAESVLNAMAKAVHHFVVNELKVASNRIVLVGRSIGTGPTCYLASYLETVHQRPAAVILHAAFTSLRDAAYDLLGYFSFLFLNRYENWRRLHNSSTTTTAQATSKIETVVNPLFAGSETPKNDGYRRADQCEPPTPASGIAGDGNGIIGCPVLFIHGDSDKIIDMHHSVMMHDGRCAGGFPSVLHIQRSSPDFKRGHNYFDYSTDLVEPMERFLRDHVPAYTSGAAITVPADRLDAVCVVPCDFQMEPQPPQRQDMADRSQDHSGGHTATDDNSSNTRKHEQGEAQVQKDEGSCFPSSLPSCRCLLCPCVLCCEASLSCTLTCLAGAADVVSPPSQSTSFRYQTKAQRGAEHLTTAKIVHALLTSKNVISEFVVEEVPTHLRER